MTATVHPAARERELFEVVVAFRRVARAHGAHPGTCRQLREAVRRWEAQVDRMESFGDRPFDDKDAPAPWDPPGA